MDPADAPTSVKNQIADMQRRAYELQEDATSFTEADDPLEEHPETLEVQAPALCLAGEYDRPEFRLRSGAGAPTRPVRAHPGAGHLAPLETPAAFRRLVLEFLDE